MLPALLATGAVVALLWRGVKRSLDPTVKEDAERKRLAGLKKAKSLNIDTAEDGLVLARRYGDAEAEKWFGRAVIELRKRRVRI